MIELTLSSRSPKSGSVPAAADKLPKYLVGLQMFKMVGQYIVDVRSGSTGSNILQYRGACICKTHDYATSELTRRRMQKVALASQCLRAKLIWTILSGYLEGPLAPQSAYNILHSIRTLQ